MIPFLKLNLKAIIFRKKAKGGYWTEVGMYAVVVLSILAVILTVTGLTPMALAGLILTGVSTVISRIQAKLTTSV